MVVTGETYAISGFFFSKNNFVTDIGFPYISIFLPILYRFMIYNPFQFQVAVQQNVETFKGWNKYARHFIDIFC